MHQENSGNPDLDHNDLVTMYVFSWIVSNVTRLGEISPQGKNISQNL
jgi:hypothetical protein